MENALTTQLKPVEESAAADSGDDGAPAGRRRLRTAVSRALTALAGVLVLFILLTPVTIRHITPGAFARVPVEAVVGAGLLLVLPGRARKPVATLAGLALGLLIILKVLDLAFHETLARPFDPVLDWTFVSAGMEFTTSTLGRAGAIAVLIVIIVSVAAVLGLTTWSVLRLTRTLIRHRRATAASVAVSATAWIACAALGTQLVPGVPVAGMGATKLVLKRVPKVRASLLDDSTFAKAIRVDAFRTTPNDRLLRGLRGKDVVLTFVESYGRTVAGTPEVRALADAGTRRLRAAGFASRSAFLTSPTAGGGSWLAHATLLSGLWVDNQQRYRKLVSSDRLTLNRAFQRAGWRSVAVMPGVVRAWPEASFFGYDKVYASRNLGYRGPRFGWSPMPDQYTLAQFQKLEHGPPGRAPVMAEMPLLSSHAPWAPIPRMVGWNEVGDGSVYHAVHAAGEKQQDVWKDPDRVRAEYRRSIEYSLESLISYVERYGDDKLVLIFLGDHQPAPIATGGAATRDVPITIVSRDPKVLGRVAALNWQEGLLPGAGAPVWPMSSFRDRFLTAFAR
ncbi:sulfatase [Actinomadura fulvescens]|uniref:Sulfatase N-terminal domain-containing protein n=1 Tax=Actinomadura fulvescens TaxID=46160 RepID=A0ABN3QR00_9ACTN